MKNNRKIKKVFIFSFFIFYEIFFSTIALSQNCYCFTNHYRKYLLNKDKNQINYFYFSFVTSKKEAALTFDDGPNYNTPDIINVLKSKNCPATFFILLNKVNSKNINIYDDSLFTLGIHGWNHDNYSKFSYDSINIILSKCIKKLKKLKKRCNLFRPPYGIITKEIVKGLKKNKIKGVLWNIDSQDWMGLKGDELINNILLNICPGSIILFHDNINTCDLIRIIEGLRDNGYKIISLNKIITKNNFSLN